MRRKIRPVIIGSHPSLYDKMEQLRKMYQDQAGIRLSQVQITDIISKRIRMPNKIDLIGGEYAPKKKRRSY